MSGVGFRHRNGVFPNRLSGHSKFFWMSARQSTLGDRALASRCVATAGIGTHSAHLLPKRIWDQQYSHDLRMILKKKGSRKKLRTTKRGLNTRCLVKLSHKLQSKLRRLYFSK